MSSFRERLRLAGWFLACPFVTAPAYLGVGGGMMFFVLAIMTTIATVITALLLWCRDEPGRDGAFLIVGWMTTVILVIVSIGVRWMLPVTLPKALIEGFLWASGAVYGLLLVSTLFSLLMRHSGAGTFAELFGNQLKD